MTGLLEICKHFKAKNTHNIDSLSYYANAVLELSHAKTNLQKHKVDALYYLAHCSIEKEEIERANKHIDQIKIISEELAYGNGLKNAATLSSRVSQHGNDVKMATLHLENAYQIAKDHKLPKPKIIESALRLARIYLINLNNKEIVSHLLFENIDLINDPEIPLDDRANFYFQLGLFYDQYEVDVHKAIENYNKSLELYTKTNNTEYLNNPLINLAECYQKLNEHKRAIETLDKALEIAKSIDQEKAYSYIYYNLGLSYFELNDYHSSEAYYRKAVLENKRINDLAEEALCLQKIGEIYFKTGDTVKAETILKEAIVVYEKGIDALKKENELDVYIANSYQEISKIYELLDDYEKSMAYHTAFTDYKTKIDDAQNTKVTERFNFLKEAAEKNKEIESLENKNKLQQLKAAEEKNLKVGLLIFLVFAILFLLILINRNRLKQKALKIIEQKSEENKLLMSEVHHRVKENLRIISNLLGVQINTYKDNATLKTILTESQNKIKSMAIIHQNLYKGEKFTKVSVNKYINDFIAEIRSGFNNSDTKVEIDVNVVNKEIKIGLAVPLGLILNELITNSYKYAFTDNLIAEKKITIAFTHLEGTNKYRLLVKDNGKGISENFDVETSNSFGLRLVHGLVAQLHGKIEVTQQQGTAYKILLEEPKAA